MIDAAFLAKKVLGTLILPSTAGLLGVAVASVLLAAGLRRSGWILLVVAVAVLLAGSLRPVAHTLLGSLERSFPVPAETDLPAGLPFVVVIGGPQLPDPALPATSRAFADGVARMADAAILLRAMCSFDPKDSTSLDVETPDWTQSLGKGVKGLRIGVPKEYFGEGLAADVEQAVRAALDEFVKLGATLVEISLPKTALSIPVYYIIAPAEASSNLSRFDGVRYGYRTPEYKDLQDMYKKTRAEGFGKEVQRRIMVGTYVLCHGYYDAYYVQAQKIRRLIADDFQAAFADKCDVIMGPVAPTVAWDLGSKSDDPVANYLADIFTLSTSLAGWPGMSIPVGFGQGEKNAKRPVGLQIIGNYFAEAKLLNIAHQYQQVTDWHNRAPDGV